MKPRILVIDDTPLSRETLRAILAAEGYDVEAVGDAREGLDRLRSSPFQMLISDYLVPGMSGGELLRVVRAEKIPCGVILLTAHGDPQLALDSMKAGADDFVAKPCDPSRLVLLIKRALEQRRLIDELEQLRLQLREDYRFHNIVSKSPKMRRIFDLIKNVGPLGSTVLIWGETGTGKELIAQAIHASDTRRDGPFIALNCAALRPRARRLHRGRPAQKRAVRGGRRWDAVPRRGGGNLAEHAGEAPPRPPVGGLRAGRRGGDRAG